MMDLLKEAVFSYEIANSIDERFEKHAEFENLIVNHTKRTEIYMTSPGEKRALIIGFCVDAHGEIKREEIPQWLVSHMSESNMSETYSLCDRFAGKYVILCKNRDGIYLWGDAVCSIQINYCFKSGAFYASFSDKFLADFLNEEVSPQSREVRNHTTSSQPMPYDMTMYDSIKALLPNHYLDIAKRKSVRVKINYQTLKKADEQEKVLAYTLKLLRNTVQEYGKEYKFSCPLTSGYDSRVVYALLNDCDHFTSAYTFMYAGGILGTTRAKPCGISVLRISKSRKN